MHACMHLITIYALHAYHIQTAAQANYLYRSSSPVPFFLEPFLVENWRIIIRFCAPFSKNKLKTQNPFLFLSKNARFQTKSSMERVSNYSIMHMPCKMHNA